MTKLFISHLLKRLRTISEVDGSFSVVDLPRWIYKGLHASGSILRLPIWSTKWRITVAKAAQLSGKIEVSHLGSEKGTNKKRSAEAVFGKRRVMWFRPSALRQ